MYEFKIPPKRKLDVYALIFRLYKHLENGPRVKIVQNFLDEVEHRKYEAIIWTLTSREKSLQQTKKTRRHASTNRTKPNWTNPLTGQM